MDASKPPSGKRMKPRAPAPPPVPQPAPRHIFRGADYQDEASGRDMKENMLSETVALQLTLPTGFQTTVKEDGSKALMDVLVELCSRYHLNPSLHTLELFTPEGHPLGFKPNALLGSLNVACVLIKEKVLEERQLRRPAPKVPEKVHQKPLRAQSKKTVRLLVNYHGSQKAVVRVNPLLPLQDLVPVICDKCDFDPALIVLLKDSISRKELPLDKSLSLLGIKELYVHDKSLVLQPKMASAPALNYSDSLCASTNSLARADKKGLLGIFQFSRRKSKTETTSLDMENDTEAHSNATSSMFGSSYMEEQSHLSQSQSAMNISRMSPKVEARKRRAPAPPGLSTHSTEHLSYDANQMNLGSDFQRKKKAPAPPPTPVSLSSGSEDVSATATPVSKHIQAPTPVSRSKVATSTTLTTTSVVIQDVKPEAPITIQSAPRFASSDLRSSTSSSTTSSSLVVQDSSSELSQSLEESDDASHFSSTTGSLVSGLPQDQAIQKSSISKTEKSESTTNISASDVSTASSSRSDTDSAMNLKMEETENNRHSGVAWLHSSQSSAAKSLCNEISPEETVSLGSNSSGMSLPDQGYADGEDSGLVSSPSETHTTSPDGSLSLDGSTGGERRIGTAVDTFSDSDEGSWGSLHRTSDITPYPRIEMLKQQNLSARLHQTLADLEPCLAESNEVPVSIVDHDVPVTTIDEVLPDEGFWADSNATNASSYCDELQNRNNNAHTATETNKVHSIENKHLSQHKQKSVQPSKTHKKKDSTLESKSNEMIKKTDAVANKPSSEAKSNLQVQKDNNKRDIKPEEKNIHQAVLPTVNQEVVDLTRVHHTISTSKPFQSKITPNVTSRFGMKTFTVVPPKPGVSHAAAGEPTSTTSGAINIDEQGNMVKVSHHRASCVSDGQDSPLHGKAKIFWSSNEKQEGEVGPNKDHDKVRDSLDSHKSARTKTSEITPKSTETGSLKTSQMTLYKTSQIESKETVEDAAEQKKDIDTKQKDTTFTEETILPTIDSSQRPAPPPFITDVRRDLSFLKPSRRTSSQYVASAITKYVPKTAIKPDYNPTTQEFPLKTQTSGRSILINPQHSFHSSNASSSSFTSNRPDPKRSISYTENISDRQEDGTHEVKKPGISEKNFGLGQIEDTQEAANNESFSSTQLNVKVNDTFKPVQHRSPSPSPGRHEYSSDKPPTGLTITRQLQALNNPVSTPPSNPRKIDETPSVTVTDTPGPSAVTVFGPVKKFKPVICKSVEKETSLHSSLMEAIHSGGGKERLKKISTPAANIKKLSYVDEENERSALMAAIRAQSSSGRLRKTKSEAAGELENFKKTALDVNSAQIASMPSSPQSSGSSPLATVAPPPPPPVLPVLKSFTPSQPNMNPVMAREAMLDAIRSGSAAEKLKKVAVPAKTVQVNGKLGTIKTASSTMS